MRVKTFLVAAVVTLCAVGFAMADPSEKVHEVIPAEGVDNIELEIDFGAGQINLNVADQEEAAILDIIRDPEWVDYDIDYRPRNKTGRLILESELRSRRHHHDDDDDLDNEWNVVLSSRYKHVIELDMGACDADIDLGGLPLLEMSVNVGATSGDIDFSKPNPVVMEVLDVDVGASSLDMHNLGNARVERFSFSCGAASCKLDFDGDFKGETELDIDVGVGSADIMVPKGVAVRVIGDDGWFSSLDFHSLDLEHVRGDIYETEDFRSADKRLIIRVDVGMGSVDIYGNR